MALTTVPQGDYGVRYRLQNAQAPNNHPAFKNKYTVDRFVQNPQIRQSKWQVIALW